MNTKQTILSSLALAIACAGCVQTRPSRNGVFNENQYVRKDFLIRPGDATQPDPGWIMQVTVTGTSTPNPLGNVAGAGLFAGAQAGGPTLVRWGITEDKLQLLDMRELSDDPTADAQGLRAPATVNAWSATNVDLKYRINLDGETTNFYEENQENDWQVRQWVKLNFAKNDPSDLAPFFADLNPAIQNCVNLTETSATLVPSSFKVDTDNGYMEFGVSLSLPISYDSTNAATCMQAFGASATPFFALGRSMVTVNLLYSFVRPDKIPGNPLDGNYQPFQLTEKDPIHHKYGAFEFASIYRDPNTGLLGANQYVMRFNPSRDIVYYFAPGMPQKYQDYFQNVATATNNVLMAAGASGRLSFKNFDDGGVTRHIGDVRYSFITWHSDLDNGSGLLGIAQFTSDPRTGQTINATVNVFEGAFKDTVQQRLDLFLQTVGAEYLTPDGNFDDSKYPASCSDGDTTPLVPVDVTSLLNRQSTVYGKMQAFLQKPISQYGYLGPANFIPQHDADFYDAYYAVLPYQVYADPSANQFVHPEGSVFGTAKQQQWQSLQNLAAFDQLAASIDHGDQVWEYNDAATGVPAALDFQHKLNQLSQQVADYQHVLARQPMSSHADDLGLFSYFDVYQKNGRHCVNGQWETRQQYTDRLITTLNGAVGLHEFGHTLGLRHNFMGSVDQRNYSKDSKGNITLFASSIMDYNQQISEAFFDPSQAGGWPAYDAAALAWIYGNNQDAQHVGPVAANGTVQGISGQVSSAAPWNDPLGFQADGTERRFLYCTDEHTAYTPLCRRYDMGATPSEIIANEIQQREWNYLWTNFRLYHKYADFSSYGQTVATQFAEYRRFLSQWQYDWSPGELTNMFRLVGVKPPQGATAGDYYAQLTNKFNIDISTANQIAASYHRAIIDQASGERPYITTFDPFYGDTTQQGIQLDKLTAIASFSSLWPAISNYDPTQAGAYLLTNAVGQDSAYNSVASSVMLDFLGAAFATYTYAQIGPLAAFAEETHNSQWPGQLMMQSWIGGYEFSRERDFLDYVHGIAVQFRFNSCDLNGQNCSVCTTLDSCTWDPRIRQTQVTQLTQSDSYNRFQGPDGRTYIWMYSNQRNAWIVADKDRNVAMYTLLLNYTTDVINGEDDGYSGAQALERKVRFALDAFQYFDGDQTHSP
jgi:hypothetical protein